jgi:hypothetical protein
VAVERKEMMEYDFPGLDFPGLALFFLLHVYPVKIKPLVSILEILQKYTLRQKRCLTKKVLPFTFTLIAYIINT